MLKYNGKKISGDQLADTVMSDIYKHIEDDISQKISVLTCEHHTEKPEVNFNPDTSKISISCCCEEFDQKVQELLDSE
ncbi:conserved hypothetical protein [Vibrio crassostreae]|uniref:hypothetical protein n=1 Tax=Vibrio crassostreae TaxID=246167 RepID=UPI000F48A581|nr:hypothetical protein [Vibrio crassostreae]ROR19901.1 hypothetical protein EDB36_1011059 [Vibrio crassostreae]CAK2158955.1 conserved hypothetical protein [Vibrio crassostreae]CAK2361484.1 conserved hypothetical protein [Vibrio crassostreae]CAK2375675.1 conserved hypothetical protein [Vibrio crassostreae]CAK3479391.1 conserved hypothetical protein [Vibrio crassostreae]